MRTWTKEQLIMYRKQKGWEDLSDYQVERVLEILQLADETESFMNEVSWSEPDIRFSVDSSFNNKSE